MRSPADAALDTSLAINGGPSAAVRANADDALVAWEDVATELAGIARAGRAFAWYGGSAQREFERCFAELVGAQHAVLCSSGTAALHLALHALGVRAESTVAVPTFSFYSVLNVVLAMGARPFLLPTEPGLLVLDLDRAVAEIPHGAAVLAVHSVGRAVDVAALRERRPDVVVLEDAADAQGTRLRGQQVGCHAAVTCWSFTTSHNEVNTMIPGGMLTTADEGLVTRLRRLIHYGKDHRSETPGTTLNPLPAEPGFNYMSSELAAAFGLATMRQAGQKWERRRKMGQLLEVGLRKHGLTIPPSPKDCEQNYYDVLLAVDEPWREYRAWALDALVAEGCAAWSYHSLLALPWIEDRLTELGAWGTREKELVRTEDPLARRLLGIRPPRTSDEVAAAVGATVKVFGGGAR